MGWQLKLVSNWFNPFKDLEWSYKYGGKICSFAKLDGIIVGSNSNEKFVTFIIVYIFSLNI